MSFEIKQDELYEDLSTILILIKKIFKNLLLKNNTQEPLTNRQNLSQQTIIANRCTQLIGKYKRIVIKKPELLNIINRFLCRVKEILTQINLCIPREKIQMIIILKKMELIILKSVSIDNSVEIISALLDILANCNVKIIHALKIKPNLMAKGLQTDTTLEKQANFIQESLQQKQQKKQYKQSELQMMMKNAQSYSVMGIDKQHFRGRYFDLKSDDKNAAFEQIMLRNRNIKSWINQYEKDYKKYKDRYSLNISPQRTGRQNIKKRVICWQISTPETDRSNLFTARREATSRSSNYTSQKLPSNSKSNQTITYITIQDSTETGPKSHRSVYEAKIIKNRPKKTIKMSNTIIDVPSTVMNPNTNLINNKRWNFYKKSQQHLKFRYKFSQNKNYNTTPLRQEYATINPEMFYTISK